MEEGSRRGIGKRKEKNMGRRGRRRMKVEEAKEGGRSKKESMRIGRRDMRS